MRRRCQKRSWRILLASEISAAKVWTVTPNSIRISVVLVTEMSIAFVFLVTSFQTFGLLC